ncbi:MAG: glycosyltransferase involved in cell wall biosynthesis [Ilumatobacter sp.]|jgi:glycosyltransferase involved in cell wall biosynthesis
MRDELSPSPAKSASERKARPRVLYLLTNEISKVLVAGQFDALDIAGFDVSIGVGLDSGDSSQPGNGWDTAVAIHQLPFRRQPSPIADLRALRATIRLIRHVKPQIVNASTPKAGLLGMLAARWCRVPIRVYHLRGLRFETVTGWKRHVLVVLERFAAQLSTHMIINSPSARAVAVEAGIGRRRPMLLIGSGSGNGIDVDRYSPEQTLTPAAAREAFGVPPTPLVIGFVGRLTRDKGIVDLIDVFDRLTKHRNDLHLLLVGDLELGDPVGVDAADFIRSRSDVTQIGWVPDTAALYPAFDLLAFPSAREGLPNVPLQAQCAGVPVVAYASTGTVDAIEDDVGGVLVPPGDTAGLELALSTLLEDTERRRRLGAAGPGWVRERFGQDRHWEQLGAHYSEWLEPT